MNEQDRKEFIKTNIKVDLIEKSQVRMEEKQENFHKDVSERMEAFNESHNLLCFHLIGDPKAGTKGWIYKFDRFSGRLTNMERYVAVLSGVLMAGVIKAISIINQ